jgi:hypothetical protein
VATDPAWIDALTYSALELRRLDALGAMHNGASLGIRSGVRPGGGSLDVSIVSSTITVTAGMAWVQYIDGQAYRAVLDAAANLTLTAAHATLPRIDLVYLRVWDNAVDASGLNKVDAVYLAGTAASSPVAPTPAGTQIYIPLANISVPASGGGAATVSMSVRPKTVAVGGILPSATAPTSPYTGQYYDDGTNLLRYNGTTWDTYIKTPGAWTPYTPTWTAASGTNPNPGNGTLVGRYQLFGKTCHYHINFTAGSTSTYGTGVFNFALPFASANLGCTYIGKAHLLQGSIRYGGDFIISPGATAAGASFADSGLSPITRHSLWDPTTPTTFANAGQIRITGTYEIA